MKKYQIKDSDGQCITVTADKFECGDNGLKFYLDDVIQAWFLSWKWFIELEYLTVSDSEIQCVDDLGLDRRVANCLQSYGVYSIADLKSKTTGEILKIPNLGPAALLDIVCKARDHGIEIKNTLPAKYITPHLKEGDI